MRRRNGSVRTVAASDRSVPFIQGLDQKIEHACRIGAGGNRSRHGEADLKNLRRTVGSWLVVGGQASPQ
jgi:hypothetical protein